METFFDRLMAIIVRSTIKALAEKGVLQGLVDAILGAISPRQIAASKPNRDDDAFIQKAAAEGWGRDTRHSGTLP